MSARPANAAKLDPSADAPLSRPQPGADLARSAPPLVHASTGPAAIVALPVGPGDVDIDEPEAPVTQEALIERHGNFIARHMRQRHDRLMAQFGEHIRQGRYEEAELCRQRARHALETSPPGLSPWGWLSIAIFVSTLLYMSQI